MKMSADGSTSWNGLDYRSAQGGVDPHHSIPYNSFANHSYSYSPQGQNFTSVPNELMHSVSMERAGTMQRSIPVANPVTHRVTSRQLIGNTPMSQSHMRKLLTASQEMPSNNMMQGHSMVQNPMSHSFMGQNVSANGLNSAYNLQM